jgi:hypothetical protein
MLRRRPLLEQSLSGDELGIGCLVALLYVGIFFSTYFIAVLNATTETKLEARRG